MFASVTYVQRRQVLMENVGHGLVLLPGNKLIGMNYAANTYPFRQDGSFLYFCGLDLPGLSLCLDCERGECVLVGPDQTADEMMWSGRRPSLEELAHASGIARVLSERELQDRCRAAMRQEVRVHLLPWYQGEQALRLAQILGVDVGAVSRLISTELISAIVRQRSVKTAEEVAEIRSAIAVSASLYALLKAECRVGITEQELYGRMQGMALARGVREAFPTILTTRGEVLHNHAHDQVLRLGSMLLVDSGVISAQGYASDITRTYPVEGRFSSRQATVYAAVRDAQRAAIAMMAPGVPFLECHLAAARAMVVGLCELGVMRGDPAEAVAEGAHALFFPHGLGHMLGLDVHDMEGLGEDQVGYDAEFSRSSQFGLSALRLAKRLESGFVVTVEPGVYFIPPLIAAWRKDGRHKDFVNYGRLEEFLDFGGIRIEDDVLVTTTGSEVLSDRIVS